MNGNQNSISNQRTIRKSATQIFPQISYLNRFGDSTTNTGSTYNSSKNVHSNITFYLDFSTGQSLKINANPNDSFESIINKSIKDNFDDNFKISVKCVLYEANMIDLKKSLSYYNIKNNGHVVCNLGFEYNFDNYYGFKFCHKISKNGKNLKGEKQINQDTPLIYLNVGNIKGFNLFGLLDGHGLKGKKISEFCRDYFFRKMNEYAYKCKQEKIFNPEGVYFKLKSTNFQFIKDCFTNADIEMTKYNLEYNWSGTSCNLVIQLNLHLICASVGDSRSIIIYDDGTKTNQGIAVFSNDHLPNLPNEMARIIKSGGMVKRLQNNLGQEVGRYRVFKSGQKHPGLPISRSLGDFIAKECGVINQPDLMELTINQNFKYLIIGSGGIWRYLKNEDIRNVGNIYYQQGDIKFFCSKLVEYAVETWEKKDYCRDDITIVSVFF